MNIKETIKEVLRKRKSNLLDLEKVHRGLLELKMQLANMELMSSEQSVSEEFIFAINSVSAGISDLQDEVSELEHSVSNVIERFKRETINIGVAGKARQGKSTLLQKISNLTDKEIPTSDDLPCTGTKSKIYHSESNHAVIEFYTKHEFSKIIYPYFDKLSLRRPLSLEDFSRSLPEFVPPEDSREIHSLNATYQDLKRIHSAFPSFKDFLSKPPETIRLEDVQEYVTQWDGQGNQRTKYMAVKTANIYTKFPNHDITGLCLVDLPGLEAAQAHEEKIVASLEQEVDAVILIKKPNPQGDLWDSDDYKVINLISVAVREIELSNWLFILLNRLDDRKNERIIGSLSENPPNTYKSRPLILTADCTNAEEVDKRVFSQVLEHFEYNLARIDRQHIERLAQKMQIILDSLKNTLKPIRSSFEITEADDEEFTDLFEDFFDDLGEGLEELVWNQKDLTLGGDFKEKVEEVCESAKQDPPVPTPTELKKQCGAKGNWPEILPRYLNQLRVYLTRYLEKSLDAYLKKTVDDALRDVLNHTFPESLQQNILAQEASDVEGTGDPRNVIMALQGLSNKERHPKLYSAFEYIIQFRFSYHSLFHHRVRKEMEFLDPWSNTINQLTVDMSPDNISEKAEEIARGLSDFYKRTVFRVSRRLTEEMQTDPTDAMFALVEEIKDRLARDMPDIKKEWRRFLRPLRGQVWPDRFKALADREGFCKKWQGAIDETLRSAEQIKTDFPV